MLAEFIRTLRPAGHLMVIIATNRHGAPVGIREYRLRALIVGRVCRQPCGVV